MKIEVTQGDITQLDVEAIVNPANSRLIMGGGLAGIIKEKGGKKIEKEAQEQAPVKVGKAIKTGSGRLPSKYVIHAPTMENPTQNIPPKNAGMAMEGILKCAEKNRIKEVAVPGLGTGVGGVSAENAAQEMIKAVENFQGKNVEKVILVGYGDELYNAFKTEKKKNFSK